MSSKRGLILALKALLASYLTPPIPRPSATRVCRAGDGARLGFLAVVHRVHPTLPAGSLILKGGVALRVGNQLGLILMGGSASGLKSAKVLILVIIPQRVEPGGRGLMKQEQVLDREQERAQLVLEPQADDAGASDLLDIIERGSNAAHSKPKGKETRRTQVAAREDPIPLELVYFRSFGQRPLLTKIEEVALAKRIDAGTRGVRRALLDAVHLAARMRKSEVVQEALSTLDEVRTLSGLSATALNLAETTLKNLAREAGG